MTGCQVEFPMMLGARYFPIRDLSCREVAAGVRATVRRDHKSIRV